MTVRIATLLVIFVFASLGQSATVSAQKGTKVYRVGWIDVFPAAG